jgi:hypothetical protein
MTKILKVDITVKNDSPTGAVFFLFFNTPHCQSWTEQLFCPFIKTAMILLQSYNP